MLYNGLWMHPQERTRVTYPYVWWDGAFTDVEINQIAAYYQSAETQPGVMFSGLNENIRVSSISWHRWSPETDWIFERFNAAVTRINNRWYGLTLNGYDSFQYTEYYGERQGKYDWHMDLHLGAENLPADMIEPRKLSVSLLLNEPGVDFKGGEFQVNLGNEAEARTAEQRKGRILAFPSWMIHRVTPVTEGVRRSLVAWVTGPKFA